MFLIKNGGPCSVKKPAPKETGRLFSLRT